MKKIKKSLPIILILSLATVLYFYDIWSIGFANRYYSAGVYSMGQNIHAFFYNSLDSIGFVSIDKPPLGFWIQTLFTKVFGFSGLVVLLPQALAGVVSVYLLYRIVNKRFSKIPALVSALILAVTPIFIAISRNNTIDGLLILTLILAADLAIKAAERSSLKHLIYAGIFIGLGFNIKMLQAYMIVPAIYLTYLVFSKEKVLKRVASCAISVVILLALSLTWVLVVDLTPENSRPYVGSSENNSALDLTLGHNGIKRIIGGGGKNGDSNTPPIPDDGAMQNGQVLNSVNMRAQGNNRIPPKGGTPLRQQNGNKQGMRPPNGAPIQGSSKDEDVRGAQGEAGYASIVRLFNEQNAGQISWFIIPSILVCGLCVYLIFRKRLKRDSKSIALFFFTMYFIPIFIYFSFSSGLAHRYYFAMIAAPIAALCGIGSYYLLKGKKKFILIVFGVTAITHLFIQYLYSDWLSWLLSVCGIIFAIILASMIIGIKKGLKQKALVLMMSVLLILPTIWSFTPIIYGSNSQLPITGPELINDRGSFNRQTDYSKLVDYLEQNRNGADYLVAVPSSMSMGADLILESGEPVMVLGGFNGGDKVVTVEEFSKLVDNGIVRFALISMDGNDKRGGGNNDIYQWIQNNGELVDENLWSEGRMNRVTLYKLR